jgi:hypothetical protein
VLYTRGFYNIRPRKHTHTHEEEFTDFSFFKTKTRGKKIVPFYKYIIKVNIRNAYAYMYQRRYVMNIYIFIIITQRTSAKRSNI